MWVLKNSTNSLLSLAHVGVRKATSFRPTSIPQNLLKSRMNNIINSAFKRKIEAKSKPKSKMAEIKAISSMIP